VAIETNRVEIDSFPFNEEEMITPSITLFAPSRSGKSTMIKHIIRKLKTFKVGFVYIRSGGKAISFYADFIPRSLIKEISDDDDEYAFDIDLKWQKKRADEYSKTISEIKRILYTETTYSGTLGKANRITRKLLDMIEDNGTIEFLTLTQKGIYKSMKSYVKRIQHDINHNKFIRMNEHDKEIISELNVDLLDIDMRIVMIFDDVLGGSFLRKKGSTIDYLYSMGRHVYISVISAFQKVTSIPPVIRENTRYLFCLGSAAGIKPVFEYFTSGHFVNRRGKRNFALFSDIYKKCTESRGSALVYDQHALNGPLSIRFFHARSDINAPPFHAFHHSFWNTNSIMSYSRNNRNKNRIRHGKNRSTGMVRHSKNRSTGIVRHSKNRNRSDVRHN